MTDATAAASLKVDIDTSGAEAKLAELRVAYEALKTSLSKSPPSAVSAADTAKLKQLEQQIAELRAANAGLVKETEILSEKLKGLGNSGKEAGLKLRTGLSAGAGSISSAIELTDQQKTSLVSRMKALGVESASALDSGWTKASFGNQRKVLSLLEQDTKASLQKVISLYKEAQAAIGTFGPNTAKSLYAPSLLDGSSLAQAQARLSQLNLAGSQLANWKDEQATAAMERAEAEKWAKNRAAVYTTLFAGTLAEEERRKDIQARWDKRKSLRSKANAEATAQAWKDEQATAAMERAEAEKWAKNRAAIYTTLLAGSLAEDQRRKDIQSRWDARKTLRLNSTMALTFGEARAVADDYTGTGKAIAGAKALVEQFGEAQARAFLGSRAYLVDNISRLDDYKRAAKAAGASVESIAANWAALGRGGQLQAALKAAMAMSGNTDQSLVRGLAGSSQAAALATQLGGVKGVEQALRQYNETARGTLTNHAQLNKHLVDTHALLRGAARGIGEIWLSWGSHVPQMVAGFAAVAGSLKSINNAMEFSYQTKFVEVLGSDSPGGLKQLALMDGLKEKASETGMNVNDLARALRVLQQTGVDAGEGLKSLNTVVQASILGETDLKTASEDIIGVIEVFGLHSKDPIEFAQNFEKVGDVMAYVANSTKANLHDVAESLRGVVGVAEQYGVKLEQVSGIVLSLGEAGIVGGKAGVYSKSMIERMYTPTSAQAQKAWKLLDYNPFDEKTGERKDISQLFAEIFSKLNAYSKPAADLLMKTIMPAERGGKAFMRMRAELDGYIKSANGDIGKATDAITKHFEAIDNASKGKLESMYSQLRGNVKQQWTELKNEFENALTLAGEAAMPAMKIMAEKLREGLASGELQQALSTIVSSIASIGSAIATALPYVVDLGKAFITWKVASATASAFTFMQSALVGMSAAVGPTIPGMINLSTVAMTAGSSIRSLATGAISGLVGALGPVGIGAALVTGALLWGDWGEAARKAADKAKLSIEPLRDLVREIGGFKGDIEDGTMSGKMAASKLVYMKQNLDKRRGVAEKNLQDWAAGYFHSDLGQKVWLDDSGAVKTNNNHKFIETLVPKEIKDEISAYRSAYSELGSAGQMASSAELERKRKEADKPATPKRTLKGLDDLQSEIKGGHGNHGNVKDARTLMNLEREIDLMKQQQKAAADTLAIDALLVDNQMDSIEAMERKAVIAQASLQAELQIAEASKREAEAKGDAVAIKQAEKAVMEKQRALDEQRLKDNIAINGAIQSSKRAIEDSARATERHIEDLAFERQSIGMTIAEQKKAEIERKRLRDVADAQREGVRANKKQTEIDSDVKSINDIASANSDQVDYQESFVGGWRKAFDDFYKDASSTANQAKLLFDGMANGMADSLTEFVMTGKLNFSDLANSILRDIVRVQMKQAVSPILDAAGSAMAAFGKSLFNANGNAFGTSGIQMFAKGGTFTNKLYNRPTPFLFANGGSFAPGIMGEAGTEAVMPLVRDSNGRLGVSAQGSSGGVGGVSIVVNNSMADSAQVSAKPRMNNGKMEIEIAVQRVISADARVNGPITRAIAGTFGLTRG